ncbi:uncharacterized protein LOC142609026 [Castanea sativa]|uniref:uncharacterized protein LOC142609026 n=1 Tax=Castanea sativa TaxID=21020 RepID=UPI003F649830
MATRASSSSTPSTEPIPSPLPDHKGEAIGRVVESYLLQWGIDYIFTIIVDNAISNDVVRDYLRRKTKDRVGSLLRCEFLYMRCCSHILNLIVQDGLKDLNESISKVHNVVWWNSISLRLESAQKFMASFERMEDDDGNFLRYFEDPSSGPPQFLDWGNEKVDELGLRVRNALNRLYKHYNGAMGIPCGASASETSEYGGSNVAVISSMLSGFGSAEERMKRYRIIFQVSRDVLTISISIVALESAFSIGGCVLDPFFSSLSPNIFEALICTQNWLRSKDSIELVNLQEAMDEVENYELELLNLMDSATNQLDLAEDLMRSCRLLASPETDHHPTKTRHLYELARGLETPHPL